MYETRRQSQIAHHGLILDLQSGHGQPSIVELYRPVGKTAQKSPQPHPNPGLLTTPWALHSWNNIRKLGGKAARKKLFALVVRVWNRTGHHKSNSSPLRSG